MSLDLTPWGRIHAARCAGKPFCLRANGFGGTHQQQQQQQQTDTLAPTLTETFKAHMSEDRIDIYTDGACSGNPGPGGWGALLRWRDHELEINGGTKQTTNNRMEMQAVIEALKKIQRRKPVHIHTDSRYVMQGITEWMPNWKRRNWMTAARKPVKNVDLWQLLDSELQQHQVHWHWVKGHSGHAENDRADALARAAIPF
jgi:ribonuclease HI